MKATLLLSKNLIEIFFYEEFKSQDLSFTKFYFFTARLLDKLSEGILGCNNIW